MSSSEHIQTENQIKEIEKDIRDTQALTSSLLPIEVLLDTYKDEIDASNESKDHELANETNFFYLGAKYLSKKYSYTRKVRGDGNCYYRSFLYALCESLIKQKQGGPEGKNEELERVIKLAVDSLDEVAKFGYDKSALEMFQEGKFFLYGQKSARP